jgi:hypothetical protein
MLAKSRGATTSAGIATGYRYGDHYSYGYASPAGYACGMWRKWKKSRGLGGGAVGKEREEECGK